jgi:hypothetical protein
MREVLLTRIIYWNAKREVSVRFILHGNVGYSRINFAITGSGADAKRYWHRSRVTVRQRATIIGCAVHREHVRSTTGSIAKPQNSIDRTSRWGNF